MSEQDSPRDADSPAPTSDFPPPVTFHPPPNSPATLHRPPESPSTRVVRLLSTPLEWLLIALVRGYQWCLSPLLGPHCRYTPTCSEYFVQAVRKYGPWSGAWRGLRRIARCHPFRPGGYDPP